MNVLSPPAPLRNHGLCVLLSFSGKEERKPDRHVTPSANSQLGFECLGHFHIWACCVPVCLQLLHLHLLRKLQCLEAAPLARAYKSRVECMSGSLGITVHGTLSIRKSLSYNRYLGFGDRLLAYSDVPRLRRSSLQPHFPMALY